MESTPLDSIASRPTLDDHLGPIGLRAVILVRPVRLEERSRGDVVVARDVRNYEALWVLLERWHVTLGSPHPRTKVTLRGILGSSFEVEEPSYHSVIPRN